MNARRQEVIELVRDGRIDRVRQLADAGDPQGCRQLAAWLVRNGRIGEVRGRVAGGDRYARRELADWLVRQGRYDEAIAEMRPLAQSGHEGSCLRLARLLVGRGRVEEALAEVRGPSVHPVNLRHVPDWLGSQGRVDLLRRMAVAGDAFAMQRLAWLVTKLWRCGRLTAAVDIITSIDIVDEYFEHRLVRAADDWRVGRLHLREVAIDLLGTVEQPLCRRVRAGLLLVQGRRDEAIAELRSLAAGGDHLAGDELAEVLRREQPVRELRALDHVPGGYLEAVAFSPDGTLLATGARSDPTVLVWHLLTGEPLHVLRTPGGVRAVAFSPDGTVLASESGGRAALWNPVTGEHLRDVGAYGPRGGMAFRADGSLVVSGALWAPATGERLLEFDCDDSGVAAVSPDGRMLALGSMYSGGGPARVWDATVRLFDLVTGEHVRDLAKQRRPAQTTPRGLSFSPDGRLLAVATDHRVQLFDPATGELVRRLDGGGAEAVAFHPAGRLVATARSKYWASAGVRLWDPATGRCAREFGTPADVVAFSPDGAVLAAADVGAAVVRLWDVPRG